MSLIVGIISQKGGVGKSTISRALAAEYARNEWEVKIADFDLSQGTVTSWNADRMANDITPRISVEQFSSVDNLAKQKDHYDLIVVDGAPASTRQTLDIAKLSHMLILPTKTTLDDLRPQIKLAHELRKNGVPKEKILFALSMVGDSKSELEGGKEYIEDAGYVYIGAVYRKDSIGQAHDSGRAANETPFKTVNQSVDQFIQAVVDHLQQVSV
ncbi:chromosome partitioning protein [Neolewinella xylanilytica]|uniref:Chromosome partitioning protein n=2 Tax=Neolewinella xylanilytica TaxID=1514080 RepID=A0A2S6HZQ1_9BACT|nr:chromosome partitioning protein [Neolewinella xylanilytica]